MREPKPESDYPSTKAWLADLDHTRCGRNILDGECRDIHCVFCGAGLGGGYARCRCEGATKAWERATR